MIARGAAGSNSELKASKVRADKPRIERSAGANACSRKMRCRWGWVRHAALALPQHRDELRQARRNCEPGNVSVCICVVSGQLEGAVERELRGGAETR